jgi:hypothetical protein
MFNIKRGKSVFKVRPLLFTKSFKWASVKVFDTQQGKYYGRETGKRYG